MQQLNIVGLVGTLQKLERNIAISLMYSGLRLSQFRVLNSVDGDAPITVSDLSTQLHITRASASTMVSELCRNGILTLVENPADRRSYFIRITELGRAKLRVAHKDLAVLIEKLTPQYPPEMVRQLNAFADGHRKDD